VAKKQSPREREKPRERRPEKLAESFKKFLTLIYKYGRLRQKIRRL
jgi:hypothetical protein